MYLEKFSTKINIREALLIKQIKKLYPIKIIVIYKNIIKCTNTYN